MVRRISLRVNELTTDCKTNEIHLADISILLFPCSQFGEAMSERESSEIYCWCKFEGIEFAEVFSMVKKENEHCLDILMQNIDLCFTYID